MLSHYYTYQQIICHVDGFNHVKKIADLSEVSIDSVRECVQHLVWVGVAVVGVVNNVVIFLQDLWFC